MIEEQKNQQLDSDQQEIRHLIWENKIPVKLTLSIDCLCSDKEPLPYYTFFQRVHHPIFYYQQIHDYFEKYAPLPRNHNDIWLEYENKPINWNIPFGVSFDLNYISQNKKDSDQNNNDNYSVPFIPINLIVHYGPCSISSQELLPIPIQQDKDQLDIAKENFKFNIKESLQIRNDNDQALMQFEVEKQNQLWVSFVQHDSNTFFPLLDELFNTKIQLNNNKSIKLATRIYIQNYIGRIQISYHIQTGKETLGDLLCKYFPKIITQNDSCFEIVNEIYKKLKVICNGIECDLNMPLLYFYKYFHHYDGFTYLCIQY